MRTVRAIPANNGATVLYSVSSCESSSIHGNVTTTLHFDDYFIVVIPTNDDAFFSIDQTSGELTVSGTLDRETISRYIVTVNVSRYFEFSWMTIKTPE